MSGFSNMAFNSFCVIGRGSSSLNLLLNEFCLIFLKKNQMLLIQKIGETKAFDKKIMKILLIKVVLFCSNLLLMLFEARGTRAELINVN